MEMNIIYDFRTKKKHNMIWIGEIWRKRTKKQLEHVIWDIEEEWMVQKWACQVHLSISHFSYSKEKHISLIASMRWTWYAEKFRVKWNGHHCDHKSCRWMNCIHTVLSHDVLVWIEKALWTHRYYRWSFGVFGLIFYGRIGVSTWKYFIFPS